MLFRCGWSLLVVSCLAVAPASSAIAQDGARAAIEAANKRFSAALAKGDAAAVAALYTADAELLPPGAPVVKGQAGIQQFWKGAVDSGLKHLTLASREVQTHGDTAHEIGTATMKDDAGAVTGTGKYVVIWKRVGGDWKLHRDIWNMDAAQ
jgi:uncharacterized protein (TIGR02246 family)